jgi:hypothetical protein
VNGSPGGSDFIPVNPQVTDPDPMVSNFELTGGSSQSIKE